MDRYYLGFVFAERAIDLASNRLNFYLTKYLPAVVSSMHL